MTPSRIATASRHPAALLISGVAAGATFMHQHLPGASLNHILTPILTATGAGLLVYVITTVAIAGIAWSYRHALLLPSPWRHIAVATLTGILTAIAFEAGLFILPSGQVTAAPAIPPAAIQGPIGPVTAPVANPMDGDEGDDINAVR